MIAAERLRALLRYDYRSGMFTWLVAIRSGKGLTVVGATVVGAPDKNGYLKVGLDGKSYRMHRLAHLYMTGEWPPGEIDHINGMVADNRWENLRPATSNQNHWNSRRAKNNTSGYKGVSLELTSAGTPRWRSYVKYFGKLIRLGSFDDPRIAHAIRNWAAFMLHGEFANHGT